MMSSFLTALAITFGICTGLVLALCVALLLFILTLKIGDKILL